MEMTGGVLPQRIEREMIQMLSSHLSHFLRFVHLPIASLWIILIWGRLAQSFGNPVSHARPRFRPTNGFLHFVA